MSKPRSSRSENHLKLIDFAWASAEESSEAFGKRERDPFLVVESSVADEGDGYFTRYSSGSGSAHDLREHIVLRIRKGSTNRFLDMVSIGRTQNNDLRLAVGSISKYHAYFVRDDEGIMTIVDAGSKNGTFVDGKPLAPEVGLPLRDGAEIRLGRSTRMHYFTPEGLFRYLADVRRVAPRRGS